MAKRTRADAVQRREKFVSEYLIDHDGERAFIAAFGPNNRHTGEPRAKSAIRVRVAELLSLPSVQREIKAYQDRARERYVGTADSLLLELLAIAHSDMLDYVDHETDQTRPLREVSRMARKAIQERTTKTRRLRGTGSDDVIEEIEEKKIKLADKLRAIELLGKHFGMWSETNQAAAFLKCLPPEIRVQAMRAMGVDPADMEARMAMLGEDPPPPLPAPGAPS
jgi:phage terminase small subunit